MRFFFCSHCLSLSPTQTFVPDFYEEFWTHYSADSEGPVTGISLVLPQSTVHLVEASPKVVLDLLRDISGNRTPAARQQQQQLLLKDVKVLAFEEDVPKRAFPTWEFRVLSFDRALELAPEEASTDSGQVLSIGMHSSMLRLGEALARMHANDRTLLAATLENLRGSQLRDLLPTAEQIAGCLEAPDIFPLGDWLALYDAPISVELECV